MTKKSKYIEFFTQFAKKKNYFYTNSNLKRNKIGLSKKNTFKIICENTMPIKISMIQNQ